MVKSFAEVKYRALATTINEILWVSYLLSDFQLQITSLVQLLCNNKSTTQMLLNPIHHERTKYIDIDCDFARHHVQSGFIQLIYVESGLQIANVFTKALGPTKFYPLLFKFNLSCYSIELEGKVKKMMRDYLNSDASGNGGDAPHTGNGVSVTAAVRSPNRKEGDDLLDLSHLIASLTVQAPCWTFDQATWLVTWSGSHRTTWFYKEWWDFYS